NYATPWNAHWNSTESESSPDQKPRILVTGASGFLGGRVMEAMYLTNSATPVGTIRGWSRAARAARFPIDLVVCDIEDAQAVDHVVSQGFDAIVHTAYSDTRESIVGGTKNLLDAAAKHGVPRFVFISTAEVYGPGVSGIVTEESPTPSSGRLYGDAKIEAEQICRDREADGIATTILRPSLIHGPFSASWTIDIAKRLQSGRWGTFDESGEGTANLVYVDDLVRAIFACLADDAAVNETFNINGPNPPTWNEYFAAFNKALDQPDLQAISSNKSRFRTMIMDRIGAMADVVLDRFEDQLMNIYLKGGWASKVMKKVKSELDATPTGTELHDLYSRSARYDDSKLRNLLNFEPKFDLDRGLGLTVQWLALQELTNQDVPAFSPSDTEQDPSLREPVAT
ncbi:MAG: NAD(P)-dependent oxidoreductase, partial [Planctomycetota bacterium]